MAKLKFTKEYVRDLVRDAGGVERVAKLTGNKPLYIAAVKSGTKPLTLKFFLKLLIALNKSLSDKDASVLLFKYFSNDNGKVA